jgi:hypothetical protein
MKLAITLTFSTDDTGRYLEVKSTVNPFGQSPETAIPEELGKLLQCAIIGLKSGMEFYLKDHRTKGVAFTYHEPRFQ